jgi:Zn-dependent metalloprotease
MSTSLQKLHYHVAEDPPLVDAAQAGLGAEAAAAAFTSNEAAARYYLDQLLRADGRSALEAVAEPDRPERVPSLVLDREQDLRPLGTHQVRMSQTHLGISVFGAGAVVELTDSRDLVSATAALDEVTGVDPVESIGSAEALERVAAYTGTTIPADAAAGARLTFFKDEETGDWHLAWLLSAVPAEPPAGRLEDGYDEGHGMGPRPVPVRYDYLVDAHDGEVLFHYSVVPTALPTPARCSGFDENDAEQTFFGRLDTATGTACRLDDPLRSVRTFDLEFADIDSEPPLPADPVGAATSDYGTTNRAAVSAHVNAGRVQDFYKSVLQRDGIDDQGMTLLSLVNVTAASMEAPPTLLNAFWWDGRMWYGQIRRGDRLVSLSRYLDVIGHELTHGVVESTSKLVYQTQSGALNESFADVAGVIINNWYTAADRHDVSTWSWEIGPGLRRDGRPLRDFADPSRLGHPDHMDKFRALAPGEVPGRGNDQGWVHFNSSIHNKAVHNLLTLEKNGARAFTVEDVAVLTYLGMARLTPRATFTDALQAVVDVAQTYFGGHVDKKSKVDAVREAYQMVGIAG